MATHKITTGRVRSKRVRQMTLTLALVLVCAMVLPLTGYLFPETQSVTAQAQQAAGDANQRSEFWRVVREGGTGYSSITGSAVNPETNTLYNITGQNWRQIRNGLIANYGGWFLFAVVIAIVLFYALRGRIDLTEPESGERVQRWGFWERSLHWYT
ncbi:MAG: formate dehydrogenase subunit gamma, partial [Gammaproteobacteria bacterium]|nr:formate dehydrogenase subunit gamma [Gammaproteobacteria bacterium]